MPTPSARAIQTCRRGIYNRVADNWRPLFQIADVAGGDLAATGAGCG